jgi:hypothetical protein
MMKSIGLFGLSLSFLLGAALGVASAEDGVYSNAGNPLNLDGGTWNLDIKTDDPLLAQAGAKKKAGDPDKCAAFRADPDADVGAIIRAGCEPTLEQMSKLMDNPLGNVAMLFTQFDWTRLKNEKFDRQENQYLYTGIAQFPKKLSKDWNLINRIVWTVPSLPIDEGKLNEFSSGPGGTPVPPSGGVAPIDLFKGRTTGFGDMYYVGLFSPEKGIDVGNGEQFLWGLGFDLSFPTASKDILGSGKWSAGPSALGVYMGKKWKVGALVQQYWDYAGPSDRDDVNLTNLQYFIYYSLDETTSIGAAPNIIANWEQDSDNRYTVPIGIGISKTIKIGKVPVRLGVEAHYSVIQPDDVVGADWNLRFYIIPAVIRLV